MDRDERDEALARLRAATEAMAPDGGLTDAVMSAASAATPAAVPAAARSPEELFARVAEGTRALDATDDLTDAVMARVQRAEAAPSWMDGVVRTGPVAVAIAVLAVAASFVLSFASQGDVEATMASSVDAAEVLE